MIIRGGKRSVLWSSVRSQGFSEPVPLHVNFTHPSHPNLDGTEWLEGAGGGQFFPPAQLGSDKTPAGWTLAKFLLRTGLLKDRILWCFSKWFIFPYPC